VLIRHARGISSLL